MVGWMDGRTDGLFIALTMKVKHWFCGTLDNYKTTNQKPSLLFLVPPTQHLLHLYIHDWKSF